MNEWYDRKAEWREFSPSSRVPYLIDKRVGETDYLVRTPDRRKTHQLCHVNMLKPYYRSSDAPATALQVSAAGTVTEEDPVVVPDGVFDMEEYSWLSNDDAQSCLQEKLSHVPPCPVGSAVASAEAPPVSVCQYAREDYLGLSRCGSIGVRQLHSNPTSDGSIRFCIDYRKLNTVTKVDSYPLPRLEDCIDRVGAAHYITKIDLKQGFWQVPLTDRAKDVSCFVVDGQTYKCHVMPYGMKNAPSTFQRLMNGVVSGLDHTVVYIDDVVIFTDTCENHLLELDKQQKPI
ncbi:uncharacterized protein LOC123511048 [Portunus trituberculatus]|uniref:uncharacterized protein LOC123511048 n=1 Tax=Portunus trituberculatus TaxID=210409 RepID=UPI001E1CEC67|nr:uncharacterized protein LOC123511048 [Portunus trituberculatus]